MIHWLCDPQFWCSHRLDTDFSVHFYPWLLCWAQNCSSENTRNQRKKKKYTTGEIYIVWQLANIKGRKKIHSFNGNLALQDYS